MVQLLLVLLTLGATTHDRGQIAQAEALVRQSMTEYNVGQFDVALDHATKAYLLDPKPGILFNIGQCQRALHRWERAEFFYRGYLRDKPTAQNRKQVEALIADMVAKQKGEAATAAKPPAAPPLALAPPPVAPSPIVIVEAPTPPPKPTHSHALALTLGVAAGAFVLVDVLGGYSVATYNKGVNSANASPGTLRYNASATQGVQHWPAIDVAAFILAAAGVTGALLTW